MRGVQFVDQAAGIRDRQVFRAVEAEPLPQQLGEIELLTGGDRMQGAHLTGRGGPSIALGHQCFDVYWRAKSWASATQVRFSQRPLFDSGRNSWLDDSQ